MTRKIKGRPLKHWKRNDDKSNAGAQRQNRKLSQRQSDLRIIGGSMRGRKFAYSGDLRTRPMMDTTREALFNLVGGWTAGKFAIDLFAGTGAVGFEAISRGALRAVLVERHIPTNELIQTNAESLGISDVVETVQANTFFWVNEFLETPPQDIPWIVFCCPPYDFYVEQKDELLSTLDRLMQAAPKKSVFAVESDVRFDAAELPCNIDWADDWKVRQYSPAQIAVLREPWEV